MNRFFDHAIGFVSISFLCALTACGAADADTASEQGAQDESAATLASLKPQLFGNLNRGKPHAASSSISGFVLELAWADVEPSAGVYDFRAIDSALATAVANKQHMKLRIFPGVYAPSWAMNLDGPAFWQYDHMQHVNAKMPRFWGPKYQAAYGALWDALAAKYDANPTLSEVNACGMGSHSCEQMLLFGKDMTKGGTNAQILDANGYSAAARYDGMLADLKHQLRIWTHTRVSLTSHPYQDVDGSGGTVNGDLAKTEAIDKAFVAAGQPHQALLFHTGLGPDLGGNGAAMYDWIIANHYPFDLQTETYARLGSTWKTWLTYACNHGVTSVELPAGWDGGYSAAELATVNTCLKNNASKIE